MYDSVSNVGFIDGIRDYSIDYIEIELYYINSDGDLIQVRSLTRRKRQKLMKCFINEYSVSANEIDKLKSRILILPIKVDSRFNINFSDSLLIEHYEINKILDD